MYSDFSKLDQRDLSLAELRKTISKQRLPEHIALIMDGNGRWAKSRDLPRTAGHQKGVEVLKETVKILATLGVDYLTVFAFSTENWNRPQQEVDFLMQLFKQVLKDEAEELNKEGVRVRVIGRIEGLKADIRKEIKKIMELTKDNQGLGLNIAINYGARAEIIDAVRALSLQVKSGELDYRELDENRFEEKLYTKNLPDPELLIRPSGELRVSNFLLWQLAYTEFYFTSTLWPDFCEREILLAIADYQSRERRFGALKD